MVSNKKKGESRLEADSIVDKTSVPMAELGEGGAITPKPDAGGRFLDEWSNEERWPRVGRVQKGHGLRGDLIVYIFSEEWPWLPKWQEAFLLIPAKDQPLLEVFEIEKKRAAPQSGRLIVKLKGIDDRSRADELKGALMCLPSSLFLSQPGENIYLREILGFTIYGENGICVGKVSAVTSNGPQDLLVVRQNEKDFLVPLIDEFLLSIDFEKKRLNMSLPPGLLEAQE